MHKKGKDYPKKNKIKVNYIITNIFIDNHINQNILKKPPRAKQIKQKISIFPQIIKGMKETIDIINLAKNILVLQHKGFIKDKTLDYILKENIIIKLYANITLIILVLLKSND